MKTTTRLRGIKQCKCMGHGIWSVDDDVGDDDDDDDDDDRLHETVHSCIIKAYDILYPDVSKLGFPNICWEE